MDTNEKRIEWIDKMLAIDDTDQSHRNFIDGFFNCINFATQLKANFNSIRLDHLGNSNDTKYNIASTRYNIPMYYVDMATQGHAINAVLVGEDPLTFGDWYFIEPQTDGAVTPGDWDMHHGDLIIYLNNYPPENHYIKYNIDENLNVTFIEADTNLVTSSPPPPAITPTPDNRKDYWTPRILNSGNGEIIFNTAREEIDRHGDMDIHQSELPFSIQNAMVPITESSVMGHLLDIYEDSNGVNHILYIDKPKCLVADNPDVWHDVIGLYYGVYDETEGKILNAEPVRKNVNIVTEKAELLVDPDGNIHVFWFNNLHIYRTIKPSLGLDWETPIELASNLPSFCVSNWVARDLNHGIFSIAYTSGELHIVWVEVDTVPKWDAFWGLYYPRDIYHKVYSDESWSDALKITDFDEEPIENEMITGLDLEVDGNGNLHLVYQCGSIPSTSSLLSGRASLFHMIYDGSNWSTNPATIDSTNTNLLPKLEWDATSDNLYLVREKVVEEQVLSAWNKYDGSQWSATETLPVRPDADAWYPTIKALNSGDGKFTLDTTTPSSTSNWSGLSLISLFEYLHCNVYVPFDGIPISRVMPFPVALSVSIHPLPV